MMENQGRNTQRRLERAMKHVCDYWIPPNPRTLDKIQSGFKNGAYDLDVSFLIDDLKRDLALFTYCIKELATNTRYNQFRDPAQKNPIRLLKQAGTRCLREILTVAPTAISKHSLGSASEIQVGQLRSSIVAVAAVESFAAEFEIDPLEGFTAAALRQLGLTLIAWNYPTVFRQATKESSAGTDLDQILSEKLGYSPLLLAAVLAFSWGIDAAHNSASTAQGAKGDGALEKLCEVGEALARANDPDLYPSAERDWEFAQRALGHEIASDDLFAMQKLIQLYSDDYLSLSRSTFAALKEFDPKKRINFHKEQEFLALNPYIKFCPPVTKKQLKQLYSRLSPDQIDPENVATLMKRIIPSTGFSAGVVFTMDPGLNKLIPRIRFGTPELLRVRDVTYSPYSDNIVAMAFDTNSPIIESRNVAAGQTLNLAAAGIGGAFKVGVLYLEYADDYFFQEGAGSPLELLKAFRQTLNDTLNLKKTQ